MEGISGITARMASLQSQVAALSPGGLATASAASSSGSSVGASGAGTSSAFSDVLAQQLSGAGASTTGAPTTGAADPLAALLGGAPGATGLATAALPATSPPATSTAEEPAYTTTTTTSLSRDGLAQLLASLTGDRAGGAPATAAVGAATAARGAASPASASAPVPVLGSGKVDAKGVPLELKAYGNGKVPEKQLVEIGAAGSGERLWAPAAAAFDRMTAAARADGVRIGVNDSYRSYPDQVDMAARKGLRSQGGLAAAPGTSSHGWGMAVDLQLDGRAQSWMRDNAGRYGFAETVSGEPWHWGFRPQPV